MKFTYPAVFHKTEQGTYEGYFPDLACCYAKGDTLDEALEDAIHSAYDWISLELTEEEPDFPPVSDVADLGKSEGEIARNIAVNIRLFEGSSHRDCFLSAVSVFFPENEYNRSILPRRRPFLRNSHRDESFSSPPAQHRYTLR